MAWLNLTGAGAAAQGAKVPDLAVPDWSHFKPTVMATIKYKPCTAAEFPAHGGLAFVRDGNVIVRPAIRQGEAAAAEAAAAATSPKL